MKAIHALIAYTIAVVVLSISIDVGAKLQENGGDFTGLLPDSILVFERAIGTDLGGKYVMVVGDENVVEQRYIELGPREDDGFVVVMSGLEGDESYIINGLLRARPGFPVTPEPEPAAGGGA